MSESSDEVNYLTPEELKQHVINAELSLYVLAVEVKSCMCHTRPKLLTSRFFESLTALRIQP